MPNVITARPDNGPVQTGAPTPVHDGGRLQGAWDTITGSALGMTALILAAVLLGAATVYLLMRRPTKSDFSKHLMYVPLLLVNAAAVYGQVAFFYDQVAPSTWPIPGKLALSVLIAAAVESIAVYVGWHAHDALLSKASATAARLRRYSYLIALIVGGINYAHFAGDNLAPTAAAIAFGLLSLLSPWLWGLHTRRAQHVQLTTEGAIDVTGATFSSERIRMFPYRAYMARRWSIDHYVTDPKEAWEGYNAHLARERAKKPGVRVKAAWMVLAGHADIEPGMVSRQRDPLRADITVGHVPDNRPDSGRDMAPAIEADTAAGHAPDMPADTAPDNRQAPGPDISTGTRNTSSPDRQTDTGTDVATDTRPDTQTPRTAPARRAPRRTFSQTPKWTKEQLKAFRLRDNNQDITYPQIAREVGVSEKTVSRWFQRRAELERAEEVVAVPVITPVILTPISEPKPSVTSAVNGSPYPTQETS